MKPLFITCEGPEGSGKSTQAAMISKWMEDRHLVHVLTKEPGSTHLVECQKIRNLLLDPQNSLEPTAELLLFLADRAQHVERFIRPSLALGIHVVSDRYVDSTLVYQGCRGISKAKLMPMLALATGGLMPNLTFIFDVPADVGLERARAKSEYADGDRMEREDVGYHMRVRQGFLRIAESISEQGRVVLINAAPPKTVEEIHKEVVVHIAKALWAGEPAPTEAMEDNGEANG